jgi:hypothetical protein
MPGTLPGVGVQACADRGKPAKLDPRQTEHLGRVAPLPAIERSSI